MKNVNVPGLLRWLPDSTKIRAHAPHPPEPTSLDSAEYISYGMANSLAMRSAAAAARFAGKFTMKKPQSGDPEGQYPMCYGGALGHVLVSAGANSLGANSAATIYVPPNVVGAFYTFYRNSDRGLQYGVLLSHADVTGTLVFTNKDTSNSCTLYWVALSARGVAKDYAYTQGLILEPGEMITLPWAKKVGHNAELVAYNADMFATTHSSDLTTPFWGRAAMIVVSDFLPDPMDNSTCTTPFSTIRGIGMSIIGAPAPDHVAASAAMPYVRSISGGTFVVRNPKRSFDSASYAGKYVAVVVGEY